MPIVRSGNEEDAELAQLEAAVEAIEAEEAEAEKRDWFTPPAVPMPAFRAPEVTPDA